MNPAERAAKLQTMKDELKRVEDDYNELLKALLHDIASFERPEDKTTASESAQDNGVRLGDYWVSWVKMN